MRLGYLRKDLLNRVLVKQYSDLKFVSTFFFKVLNKDCYYNNNNFFSKYIFFWIYKRNLLRGLNICYFTVNKRSVLKLFHVSRHDIRFSLSDNFGLKRSLW